MVRLERHQPAASGPTTRDIVRVQQNVDAALTAIQSGALTFVSREPATSNSPGDRFQAWLGSDGALKVCVSPNRWVLFQGVSFP